MDNDNSQVKPILPNMPSGRSSQYSATDYRRYFCQQGMTLHDLYNKLKMYDLTRNFMRMKTLRRTPSVCTATAITN